MLFLVCSLKMSSKHLQYRANCSWLHDWTGMEHLKIRQINKPRKTERKNHSHPRGCLQFLKMGWAEMATERQSGEVVLSIWFGSLVQKIWLLLGRDAVMKWQFHWVHGNYVRYINGDMLIPPILFYSEINRNVFVWFGMEGYVGDFRSVFICPQHSLSVPSMLLLLNFAKDPFRVTYILRFKQLIKAKKNSV